MHDVRRQALALPRGRANGLCLHPMPRREPGEAGGRPGRRQEVGGVPPERLSRLILVPWARLLDLDPCHRAQGPTLKAQWTILAYLAADNDLEGAALADIKEMERVGSRPGQVEIVVQVDRGASDDRPNGDWHTARRYYITRGRSRRRITSTLLADLGDVNTGDPRVLEDFLAFGVRAYPAERYALIIWNHGSGVYVPEEMLAVSGARSHGGVGGVPDIMPLQPHSPFPAMSEPVPRLDPLGFGLAYDDRSGDCLDTLEIERVLATGHRLLGRKIDLVGMDACLMAMLEIAWQIRDHARVLVASEEIEPGTGWPYAAILRDLIARPAMGPAELATTIVRRYAASYRWPGHGVTQSAIDLSRLDELVDAVDRLARVLLAALPGVRLAVVRRPSPDAQLLPRPLRRSASLCVPPGARERPGRRAARVHGRDGDHHGEEGQESRHRRGPRRPAHGCRTGIVDLLPAVWRPVGVLPGA